MAYMVSNISRQATSALLAQSPVLAAVNAVTSGASAKVLRSAIAPERATSAVEGERGTLVDILA